MSARRTKFYLDKRNAKFLGVCSGIGDYFGLDPLWVRVGLVLAVLCGLGPLIILYFLMAWFADDKPRALYDDDVEEVRFWQRARVAPGRSIRDVRSSFRDIDRRLADVERFYTSGNSRLAAEIESLRKA